MRIRTGILAVALALSPVVAAQAQTGGQDTSRGAGQPTTPSPPGMGLPSPERPEATSLPKDDAAFLDQALRIVTFGLESSRMAIARTDDEEARLLAEGLITDFTAMGDAITSVASLEESAPPAELDAGRAAALAELRLASPAEFTDVWLSQQIAAHEDAVNLFQQASKPTPSGDQSVADLARSSLPKLRENLAALKAAGTGVEQAQGAQR